MSYLALFKWLMMVHMPFKGLVKLDRKYHAMLTMTNLTRAVNLN